MTSATRKRLIWTAIIAIALLLFIVWVRSGNPSDLPIAKTEGPRVELVEAEAERIPSVSLAKPIGWKPGQAPVAASGLAVNRFAEGLDHARTMLMLPNGDLLVTLTNSPERKGGGITGFFQRLLMGRVGAGAPSPNKIVLLRDADGDGKAEQRFTFREKDMQSPSGMAYVNGTLYIANHNAILAFAFTPGATTLVGAPNKIIDLPGAGNHWMRNLLASEDGKRLYVAIGSASNIGENGMEAEVGRAGIWEIDLSKGTHRQFASGMRNPNGMAWNPSSGELWAVVNERDMLGPDLVPDYLTNVPVGAQYGWPWAYWKDVIDWRVKDPMPLYLTEYARRPEYALGAHTAPLGLVFSTSGNRMGEPFANGAFIARHGSWNRVPPSGYDVVFVNFDANGNPKGKPEPVLSGFLTDNGRETRGRPVWVAWDKGGALLVSDDTGGMIWRVVSPTAKPSTGPKPVAVGRMPALRSLEGDTRATFREQDRQQE